jgi:N-formylglutamate amidohydrolase
MDLTDHFAPPFVVKQPAVHSAAVVFNSPHSGSHYPAELRQLCRLDPVTIRKSEDSYVDELFAAAPCLGCPMLAAAFPRVFLDVNREPYELDPAMFDAPLPAFVNTTSLRVAGGLGTIPRIVAENEPIYNQLLTWDDAVTRIERIYRPYHDTLANLLALTRATFGHAVLVDCHSMPSSAARLSTGRRRPPAAIIIGDRYGSSCDTRLTHVFEALFRNAGFSVVHNKPYAGGHITQAYGRPGEGLHALQVEINRALYMNERTLERLAGFERLQQTIAVILEEFIASIPDLLAPLPLAAE